MNFPKDLKYAKTDEWVRVDGEIATIGISDFAQDTLSDIVFLEFASEPGDTVSANDNMGTVESVKAASDLNYPVSGSITELHTDLSDSPDAINEDPYQSGWMLKMKLSDPAELDGLMDAEAYEKYCQDR